MRKMKYDYQTYFTDWKDWDHWDACEPRFDGVNGVYAFRLKSSFGRLRGTSQVLYVGMCDQNPEANRRPGIWHRLRNYRQNNDGSSKRLKEVEAAFGGRSHIQYAYHRCGDPRTVERAFLADYHTKHLELPPLNRNR
jgi:hypothetical protein